MNCKFTGKFNNGIILLKNENKIEIHADIPNDMIFEAAMLSTCESDHHYTLLISGCFSSNYKMGFEKSNREKNQLSWQ